MAGSASDAGDAADRFIERWKGSSGAERANYALFLTELCDLLGVERPRPSGGAEADYVFERSVRFRHDDGSSSPGRIDLYRRGCFVLEAKQSKKRVEGGETFEQLPLQLRGGVAVLERPRGKAKPAGSWDALMVGAKRQAEGYARCLDEWPPFVVVADVGHVIELYANFRRDGKGYEQFPDRNSFRIAMDDLRRPEIRARLKAVWTAPFTLDPSAHAAEVTQGVAALLARMTRSIEGRAKLDDPELRAEHAYKVSKFLMRCIFAMFAEDVGLLPERAFLDLIGSYKAHPQRFHLAAEDFFRTMDKGGHSVAVQADIRRFNGGLFRDAIAVELNGQELDWLEKAARQSWRFVEPAIFGTLLEQALSERERAKLGAHYTPRAYVERLVVPTIIEPLRDEWSDVQTDAIGKLLESGEAAARSVVKRFHDRLCDTLVLDPACGTGNFLYVALELMKRLEGEVLEFLAELGEPGEPLRTVDPHQFLGIEKNPRAAPIAELVLWIGYIQWWFRTRRRAVMAEPILKDFGTIQVGDAVLAYDREELLRDADGRPITRQDPSATRLHPVTGEPIPDPDARLPVYRYVNPRPAVWPEADFIVGNPPFIGKGGEMREELGDGYVEALWASRGRRSDSIDYVMYWWDQAATVTKLNTSRVRRFGFITTNSIDQTLSRRVLAHHLRSTGNPLSIVYAITDHPWIKQPRSARGTKAGKKASVRIAMTVAERGIKDGRLGTVLGESGIDSDQPQIDIAFKEARIAPDLRGDSDTTEIVKLTSNLELSWNGVMLAAAGFRISAVQAERLRKKDARGIVRPFVSGDDLTNRGSSGWVLDAFGLNEEQLRVVSPDILQHLLERVRPQRATARDRAFRERWWLFGRNRPDLRAAIAPLDRYIGTTETAKHRVFQFIDSQVVPDHMVVSIALGDAFALSVLSSRVHGSWSGVVGGTLEDRPRYTKSSCFDPFPFPDASSSQQAAIRDLAEELDALRKRVLAEHGFLTMTRLYNVRARLVAIEAGRDAAPLTQAERAIHEAGCVGVVHELHRRIDAAVADAYGWPADLPDDEILARLVALNRERAAEERDGHVRWLRPDYQLPRFGIGRAARRVEQVEAELAQPAPVAPALPAGDLSSALRQAMRAIGRPADPREIAGRFRDGPRAARRVERALEAMSVAGVARRVSKGWFVADRAS